MATLIAIVSKVVGQVFAVAGDGTRRALVEGDRLFAGEQLVTGAEGAVAAHLQNGQELTLGRGSSLHLSAQLLANQPAHVDSTEALTPSQAQLSDVEQVQQAIAAGADPTQVAEATAAGPGSTGAPGTAGGGHSFVLLEEVAGRVDPVIGFPTAGFNGIPEFVPERLAGSPEDGGDDTGTGPSVNPLAPVTPINPELPVTPELPVNHPVTLSGLSVAGGELTLYEANLTKGSASNPGALTQNGTFSISAPDGLQSLSIGGVSIISGGVAVSFPQTITSALGNTLTIIGYDPATGVVSYSYTLVGNETHSAGDGSNNLSEHFTVVASDVNGDTASNTLDINITDDVPHAFDDGNGVAASETHSILTGNVLDNDVQGADRVVTGPITPGTFTGTYGTLVLAADGSYTYTLHSSDPAFLALKGDVTETFNYTLTDADGDSSSANLVLNVHNNDDPVLIDGLKVQGGELTVYERALSDGSTPGTPALTQSGTFTVTALDGVQTLTVGGINVVTAGVTAGFPQTFTTALGNTLTITGYDAASGVVSYSYTLNDNEAHPTANGINSLSESFSVTVTDSNGTTASDSLDVNIVDDVPQAKDDGNAVTATELHTVLTGNVLDNDVQGADRVISGPVTAGTLAGAYGQLVLAADGSYTYTVDPTNPAFLALKADAHETFTYTLTDADGDTSTATLTLTVHNNDDPVLIDGLKVQGGELTVYERTLSDGSTPGTPALTQIGTFTVTALDGVQTLTVGGINVLTAGVTAGFPQTFTTALGNTLTITGYDAASGVVSYSYTLNDNEAHPTANGINSLSESFSVTVTDSNGTTASDSLDVNIVDDVPQAKDDGNAVTATELHTVLTGNVLDNDVQGADRVVTGPITPGTFTGTYGTLVLAADGSYTYTLHSSDPAFLALKDDVTETFNYTLTDADGDSSSANLVLNVHNNDDPVLIDGLKVQAGELTVYERALSDGSTPGTPALTQSGTFTVTALDGVQSLTVGGINVVTAGVTAGFPQTFTTALGNTLTITGYDAASGVVSYSYTLNDNEAHPTANGINSLSESFSVTVTDSNGTTASDSLDVNIVDDVPQAKDDGNAVTATELHTVLTGNVLDNDVQGADRVISGPVTAGTLAGAYGQLVLAADGSYTYTVDPTNPAFLALKADAQETFTYTLTDADGDTSTATLTLTVHNNDDPVLIDGLKVQGGELTVYERALSDGSTPGTPALTQSGTFTVTALDGVQTLTVGGINVVTAGVTAGFPQTFTTALGNTLTITGYDAATGVVSYSYTLNDNEAHPTASGINSLSESFSVTVTDSNGTTASDSLDVNIVDDVPQAKDDGNAVTATELHTVLTGNVLDNDVQGADRVISGPVTAGTLAGAYGQLVLAADGSYTYTVDPTNPAFLALKADAHETFTYTLTDADGDTSTATLTLTVHNNDDPVLIDGLKLQGGELTVYERALSDGSTPGTPALTQSGTFTVTALDGVQTLTVGGINVVTAGVTAGFPQTFTTALGNTLTITGYDAASGVVSYSYTLNDNEAHPTANGINSLSESFSVTVTDSNGTTASDSLDVNIVDDVPQAKDDGNAVTATELHTVLTGNVLDNDVQGADRVVTGPITPGTLAGAYGQLVLAADGSYTYTVDPTNPAFLALKADANETFTYTLTDADGDTSTATLTLTVHNNDDPVLIDGLNVCGGELTVYERALSDGSTPGTPALTQSGTFTVTALDGLQTLTVGGINVVTAGVTAGFPQTFTTALGNTLTITGYDAASGVVSYSYTLNDNEDHPTANGANSLSEHFTVTVTDSNGTTASDTLDVNIVDDLPTASPDSATVGEGATVNISVLGNDVNGADGAATGGAVVGVRAGGNTATSALGGLGDQIQGTYGYLTLDAAGNAVYHSTANGVSPPGATDVFTYTIRDGDGDESTTTITINVTDSGLIACVDACLTVYEKALDLSQDGQDLAPGLVIGSDPTSTGETAHGSLVGSVSGGSGALTYTLVGSATGTYGQILLNPDGTYTYTLTSAPKTAGGNDGPNILTESFTYKVTDALGNTATSSVVVNIVDDVPRAQHSERSVTAVGIDSNLLLVIDVSGSMADHSGVSGLSRMDLAKQAISALLDKYDAMGDVKVQIVTFSSSATEQTSIWVDVTTAKWIISTLYADGGTNYDDALAAAKQAFMTEGKLAGAQNVGYFFSDGKPNDGWETGPSDEAAWKAFLEANGIKNYAIGLGDGVSSGNLNPLAYDGSNHVNTNAQVVTDLNQLNAVLSGTVGGAPISGLLMGEGGSFGADGGFIKTIIIEGTTYSFDPNGDNHKGALTVLEGFNRGTFNTLDNSLTIATTKGGTLVINLDTGEFTYTSQTTTSVVLTEQIAFTASDYEGDLASRTLTINILPNAAPVAVDDQVITNVLSKHIAVPAEGLLANDTDANGDHLSATPTTFNTGWIAKGEDFIGSGAINFSGTQNNFGNRNLADVRSAFAADTAAMTALLVISGYLGRVTNANANDEDFITVTLKKGETLNLDHNLAAGHISLEYSLNGGGFLGIDNHSTLSAAEDGTYRIHVSNLSNSSGSQVNAAENYQLNLTVNYAGAHESSPDFVGSYTASDNHGGSDSAAVSITYQAGHTLTGTAGDDVLLAGGGDNLLNAGDGNDVLTAGNGNNQLHGGAGNDLLFSGLGSDLLDGGVGIDTASYAHANAGVVVNLGLLGAQNTGGAGMDTLTGIENLIGSTFDDTLIGNNNANTLTGGLGNNTLTGGGGADTFQWLHGNSGHDLVTDFTPGTDKLDLSQLLQGEAATASSLDDYLHFSVTGSGASLLTSIDVKATIGAPSTQTIDLAGVNLAEHYGVTPGAGGVIASGQDTATIINGMLNDHSLKVDTV